MILKHAVRAFFLAAFASLAALGKSQAQSPDTLVLTGKLRDFLEINARGVGPVDPDFNSDLLQARPGRGYVDPVIRTDGKVDPSVFPLDNRNPALKAGYDGTGAFTSAERFDQWYDDRDTATNRPFLVDLKFVRQASGMYVFNDDAFFPLDDGGPARNLPGNDLKTFGMLQNCCKHDYGFTMEFHAQFTYLAKTGQVFNFKGDDDAWVFINDKLVIDLGGIHGALSGSVDLDKVAASLGLKDHEGYLLDFFFAERHTTASHCQITTTLFLGKPKVAAPSADPAAGGFTSHLSVNLSDATPDAAIHYTLDGSIPDAASPLFDPAHPLQIIATTTLKAVALKPGWVDSDVLTNVYTKAITPSSLEIEDENGNPLAGGYLSEADSGYRVRVITTQAGLNGADASAVTAVAGDRETMHLSAVSEANDGFVFTAADPFPFKPGAAAVGGDGRTQASLYDSLTVSWANPSDPKDVAYKSVAVRPAPRQARAYFSTKPDGSDTTDQFAGTETKLYLVVIDEPLPAGLHPSIALETAPRLGQGRSKDVETLTLAAAPSVAGKYVFAIPVDIDPSAKPGDGRLQLSLEDGITATYSDPMDKEDHATANAGFGAAPEITASLQFTDKDGNPVPAGTYYDPAAGALYVSYRDDWAGGSIANEQVVLTVENDNGWVASDSETFTAALVPSKRSGSSAVWEGSIPLANVPGIAPGDRTAETYMIGKAMARVVSHDKAGNPQVTVTDEILVADPDRDAQVDLEGSHGPTPAGRENRIGRDDAFVRVTVKDQSLSDGRDTLLVNLSCRESRDVLTGVRLIEKDGEPGAYVSADIPKSEGSAAADSVLQCAAHDDVKASYKDPVYGGVREATARIGDDVVPRLYFASARNDTASIGSVSDRDAGAFFAVVEAAGPTVDKADVIMVELTTAQGERELFSAVETGPYTGRFVASIPFAFAFADPEQNDGVAEGRLNRASADNRVPATASVNVDGIPVKADILLISAFTPALRAWIKDFDGDGAADHVYLQFDRKPVLPSSLEAQWNAGSSAFASSARLAYAGADSTRVLADYSDHPFPAGLTAVAAGDPPKARLPSGALFQGQSLPIEDSIGPVILQAIKKPARLAALVANDSGFYHDTLVVKTSEPLVTATDLRRMIKFAIGCSEYSQAITVVTLSNPVVSPSDPDVYILAVDNSGGGAPQTGNCVFLNADPGITDAQGNPPAQHGVALEGANRERVIQSMRGYPPVAGLDPNQADYLVAVQDDRDANGSFSTASPEGWDILWIPPAGFEENKPYAPYTAGPGELPGGPREVATPVRLPQGISAVQVVSSAAYTAHITIFDHYGAFVKSSVQTFGGRGELENLARVAPNGLVSYLVWDQRDRRGQLAAQGAYVWKVLFKFTDGKSEVRYMRTGLLR